MVGRTSQKTITLFAEHFCIEENARAEADKLNKKFKTSEFFRWCLENKTDEYIDQLDERQTKVQDPQKYNSTQTQT